MGSGRDSGGNSECGVTIAAGANGYYGVCYTAPAKVPAIPTVTVTAVSNAEPAANASMLVHLISVSGSHGFNLRGRMRREPGRPAS